MGWWDRFKKKLDNRSLEQLLAASQHGHVEAAKRVLAGAVDINGRHRISGRTALMECAANGHIEVAEILLSKGANVNARSRSGGRTALMKASEKGHADMAKILLSHLAEIDNQDNFGKTALILATRRAHTALVELLLKHGADPDLRDNTGKSALEFAKEAGRDDLVKLLADRGAGSRTYRAEQQSSLAASELDQYYAVLQCNKTDSTDHIKRQYRRLVKDFHPDAIQGKGLHNDFVRFASQRFQDIEEAYGKIMKHRRLNVS